MKNKLNILLLGLILVVAIFPIVSAGIYDTSDMVFGYRLDLFNSTSFVNDTTRVYNSTNPLYGNFSIVGGYQIFNSTNYGLRESVFSGSPINGWNNTFSFDDTFQATGDGDNFTLSFWANTTTDNILPSQWLFSTGTHCDGGGGYGRAIVGNGFNLTWHDCNNPANRVQNFCFLGDGLWHHCVVIKNGTTLRFFSDGSQTAVSTNTYDGIGDSARGTAHFMRYEGTSYFSWNGSLDNFVMYNYTLNLSEIIQLNNSISSLYLFGYEEISQTFNASTYESAVESFNLNISYDTDIFSSVASNLIYNGTSYFGTKLYDSTGKAYFVRTIDIPISADTTTQTKNLYWAITFINSTGSFYFNSSFQTQTVESIIFTLCNSTYPIVFLNFTLKDEETSLKVNGTFSSLFSYWSGEGLSKKNYSFSSTAAQMHNFSFCAFPNWSSLKVDANIDYDATGYSPRTYYLVEAPITNTTSNLDLLLLNESTSVKFFFTLTQSLTPITDAIIIISKYDTATATYKTVGIRKSDTAGKFVEYLELDKQHQFSISKGGSFLGIIYKTSVCTAAPCEIALELTSAITDLWSGYYDIYATNVAYNLTYNPLTKNITFVFVDLTGLAQYFRLQVNQISYNDTGIMICNKTSYTTAGTLFCELSGYEGQFRADAFISRSPEKWIDTIYAIIAAIRDIIGNEGLFWTFIALVTVALIGAWNPVVGIILAAVVMFFSVIMGFLSISFTAIIVIFILAIFLIVKMGRGGGI